MKMDKRIVALAAGLVILATAVIIIRWPESLEKTAQATFKCIEQGSYSCLQKYMTAEEKEKYSAEAGQHVVDLFRDSMAPDPSAQVQMVETDNLPVVTAEKEFVAKSGAKLKLSIIVARTDDGVKAIQPLATMLLSLPAASFAESELPRGVDKLKEWHEFATTRGPALKAHGISGLHVGRGGEFVTWEDWATDLEQRITAIGRVNPSQPTATPPN